MVFICSHSFPLQYLNVSVAYVCHLGICTWVFVYSWSRNKFHRHTDPGWNPSEIWPTFHQNSPMSRSSSHQTTSMDFYFYLLYYFLICKSHCLGMSYYDKVMCFLQRFSTLCLSNFLRTWNCIQTVSYRHHTENIGVFPMNPHLVFHQATLHTGRLQ